MPFYRRQLKFWSFIDPLSAVEGSKDATIQFGASQRDIKSRFVLPLIFDDGLAVSQPLDTALPVDLVMLGRLSLAFSISQTVSLAPRLKTALAVEQALQESDLVCLSTPASLTQAHGLVETDDLRPDFYGLLSSGYSLSKTNVLVLEQGRDIAAANALMSWFLLDADDTQWSTVRQGHALQTDPVLMLKTQPRLSVGSALATHLMPTLRIRGTITIGNTFTMQSRLRLIFRGAFAVATRLQFQDTAILDSQGVLRQSHPLINALYAITLVQKGGLSVAYVMRKTNRLDLQSTGALKADQRLRLFQTVLLQMRPILTQSHGLVSSGTTAFSTRMALIQAHLLQNSLALAVAVQNRLSAGALLKSPFMLQAALSATLKQVAFLRAQYPLFLETRNIVRQGMYLRNTAQLLATFKSPLKQAAPLKQTLTLQTQLAGTFRNAHYLKTNALLNLQYKAMATAAQPLKSNPTLVLTPKITPIQGVPLKQKLTLQETLTGVFRNNAALKTTSQLVLSEPALLRAGHALVTKPTLVLTPVLMPRQAALLKQAQSLSLALSRLLRQAAPLKTNPSLIVTNVSNLNLPNNYEAETYALLNRMNPVPPTVAARDAINTYIKNLKAAGVWALLDYVFVFAANAQANAILNWVSTKYPISYATVQPTFTASKGFTFDKTGAYLTVAYDPSKLGTLFTQNNAHISARTLNAVVSTARDVIRNGFTINSRPSTGNITAALNGNSQLFSLTGYPGNNHFLANRDSAGSFDLWSLTGGPNTALVGSAALGAGNTLIGETSSISNRQVAFTSAGAALSNAQARTFISETTTLLTALGAI